MGLYDRYKAVNSSVIPMYAGSAIPEITKLFEVNQAKYDKGYSEDAEYADIFNNLPQPFNNNDKQTMLEMNRSVQDAYKKRMAKGDYEYTYRDVEKEAREMTTKIKPIMDVMKADADYQDKLDKSNLAPEDKAALIDMARTRYTGMKWDANGRPISTYSPPGFVNNVDVLKILQERLQIMHASGTEVVTHDDNGYSVYDHGEKVSTIDPNEVAKVYNAVVNGDESVRASNEQNIRLKAWNANKGLNDKNSMEIINSMPDTVKGLNEKNEVVDVKNKIKFDLLDAASKGSPAEVLANFQTNIIAQRQREYQLTYALGKSYRESSTTSKSAIGDIAKHEANAAIDEASQKRLIDYKTAQDKLRENEVLPGSIRVDGEEGSWDDFATTMQSDYTKLESLRNDNQAQRNAIARTLGITPDKLTKGMINTYFESRGLTDAHAAYNNNVQEENALNVKRQEDINMISKLDDRVLSTKEFGYTTLAQVRSGQQNAIMSALNSDPNNKATVKMYRNYNEFLNRDKEDSYTVEDSRGVETRVSKTNSSNQSQLTYKQIAEKLKGATIERTERGGLNTERTVTYKLKDGSYMVLSDSHATGKLDTGISSAADFDKKLEKAKKDLYANDIKLQNQTMPIVIMSKSRTEQSKNAVMASGSLNITSLTGTPKKGAEITNDIAAGRFEVLGATKPNKLGNDNSAAIIQLLDDSGKATGAQYIVNYSSTSALTLSDDLFKQGKQRNDDTFIKTSRLLDQDDPVSNFFNNTSKNIIYIRNGKNEVIGRIEKAKINGKPDFKVYDKNGNWDQSIPNNASDAIDYLHYLVDIAGAHVDGFNPVTKTDK